MTSKKLITWLIAILVLIVAGVLYYHFSPIMTTIQVSLAFAAGLFGGWQIKRLYDKYVK